MTFDIKVIPHKDQRYDTCGDWIFSTGLHDDKEYLSIKVSALGDWKMEFLVGIHELIEAVLCKASGVTQMEVDQFDMAYEQNRKEGDLTEPGNSLRAPYRTQHRIATWVERFLAFMLKVNWKEYGDKINEL